MFKESFRVLSEVTRKIKWEQEQNQSNEQDPLEVEGATQEQCLNKMDELHDNEPDKTSDAVKLFKKDEYMDEWRTPYIEYLSNQILPTYQKERDKVLWTTW